MKDEALRVAREAGQKDKNLGRNRLREYMQHLILRELFETEILNELIFHGGTALRMLHGLNQFSEDLDFHLADPDPKYKLQPVLAELEKRMDKQGYRMTFTEPTEEPVVSSFLKYEQLLYEANLSAHENEKLSIKLEIDTRPPAGFGIDSSLLSEYFIFSLKHHDRASFLAGKCHAVLQRSYAKGRDYFDLLFYLNRWSEISPNFEYLNNALAQTEYEGPKITDDNWKKLIQKQVKTVDWTAVKEDARPFLLDTSDLKAFQKKFLLENLED